MLRTSLPSQRRLVGLALALATLALFARVGTFEFVLFDDPAYVYENPAIAGGLTREGVVWVFTHSHVGNWHPLTGLSHLLDCQLFGLHAGGHHLTSAAIHALNAALLFLVLSRLSGAPGRSLVVAIVFAVHPLRVESVAWVSERKDVLSGFFWILTLAAYARYAKRPAPGPFVATLVLFILGLLSKPMVVTLPLVLLLMDYWPLRRWQPSGGEREAAAVGWQRLVVEKIPFLLCSLALGVITLLTQREATASLATIPLWFRLKNALLSFWRYISKSFWPTDLAFLYPLPAGISWWAAALAGVGLVVVSVLVLRLGRRFPYLVVGWFWYLITLLPVIGLIQVGRQAFADRYTYLPQIGLLILVVWAAGDLLTRWRIPRPVCAVGVGLIACLLAAVSWRQLGSWANSEVLFSRALEVTDRNSLAHNNYGCILIKQGRGTEAMEHLRRAIEYDPLYEEAHYNLGMALMLQDRLEEALPHYAEAVRLNPRSVTWRNEYGLLLARLGREDEALAQFQEAVRHDPRHAGAHNNLGVALAKQGKVMEAIEQFRRALQLKPDYPEARDNLQRALAEQSQRTGP